jgi:hypothetical protein
MARYERARLALTNEVDSVIPTKVATKGLGSETAISGIGSTALKIRPLELKQDFPNRDILLLIDAVRVITKDRY